MENQEKNETTVLPENPEIMVKNPRIGKVRKLEEEVRRQNELEQLRTKRIRKEQEYIEQMSKAVEDHLRNTREEQRYNEEFERLIRKDVYRMHGISEDKLQGMTEYRNAWYQGTAFGMFFLSLILTGICGYLHGFGSELCIFMAFYTAIEGTLLTNGKRQHALLDMVTRILYLLLFPAMLIVFVCFELGFTEYGIVVPVLTIAGVVILVLGAVSYFVYDPYRLDRKNHKKADRYIRDIEKAAVKEVELEEKALAKQARKQEKLELKEEARQERAAKRTAQKNGEYVGATAPYGYCCEKINGIYKLVKEPESAKIVQRIFAEYTPNQARMTHRLLLIISILRKHHDCLLAPVFVGVRQGNGVGDSAVKVPVFAQHNPLGGAGQGTAGPQNGAAPFVEVLGVHIFRLAGEGIGNHHAQGGVRPVIGLLVQGGQIVA